MMATAKKATKKVTNATNKVAKKVAEETNGQNPIVKTAHTLMRASIGAVVLGKEELGAVIDHLIEKGEVAEQESIEKISGLLDRSKLDVSKSQGKVESILDERIQAVLNTMNIPSKSDIETLTKKISTLSRKVNELDKKLTVETRPSEKKAA